MNSSEEGIISQGRGSACFMMSVILVSEHTWCKVSTVGQQKPDVGIVEAAGLLYSYIYCKKFLCSRGGGGGGEGGWTLFLLVLCFELVCERKLGGLFLELGELVLVLGHLLEGGLDELALHVRD